MHATDRSRDRRPLVIGLTGGIASGKTTVADLFAGHGVPVLDTDVISREVVAPGTQGLQKVRAAFGDAILEPDGSLNRAALRQRIFEDPDARRQLEAIVHPLVFDALDRGLRTAGGPYQIHVIPLLVETGLQNRIDRVLVIDCEREVQLARLLARCRWSGTGRTDSGCPGRPRNPPRGRRRCAGQRRPGGASRAAGRQAA